MSIGNIGGIKAEERSATKIDGVVRSHHRGIPLFMGIILIALLSTLTQNIVFWRGVSESFLFDSGWSYLFFISLFITLWLLSIILFTLLLWGKLRLPVVALLFFLSTLFNYYSYYYQIYMDRDMLINIIETNSGEVVNLITLKLFLWLLIGVGLPLLIVMKIPIRQTKIGFSLLQRLLLIVGSLLLLLGVATLFYKDYASYFRNNRPLLKLTMPFSYISSGLSYTRKLYADNLPYQQIGEDAYLNQDALGEKKRLFILVVGETARSKNFSLNGYEKETNPRLAQEQNLVSFKSVSSCGTATAISVPCMFSRLTRETFDKVRASKEDNLLDILQRVGYQVLWRENDNGCKGVCDRVPTQYVEEYLDQPKSITGFYYDQYLLTGLADYIAEKSAAAKIDPQNENLVIVLHMNGSHGPTYYQRYPEAFRQFTPSCDTNKIETCDQEALANVYDNTILYTDYVLAETIGLLKRFSGEYETAMLYISDHGESLGENRFYLHGAPYAIAPEEQKQVPMIFWADPDFYQNRKLSESCLLQMADEVALSQDNLFHSLLGLLSVESAVYDESMNLFKACQTL
ncbi:phosphoethanolamine transferase EptA [Ignatzschineria indica]|uniref:Phosphoethanolamine transferase EptA n=1 Tax=Ignatzschineria indica TaxID=472583 RepID=A0A2U2AIH8_9GAMM|nr:phosphoethanolamine--lipid A transferase [Ignatzschineria indica]PWD82389.1 phosphoethanolamine transferase EptA [Ignatzschineria indica]GGZ86809.1 phosphoethanolamine transferase EptA [Ignatzschineria indica]